MNLLKYTLLLFLFVLNATAFTTSGNKILDPYGNPILLRGFARPSLEWSTTGEHLSLADYTLMKNKGANVVRLAMNQCFWLSNHAGYSSSYAATIAQQVAWVKSLGMAIILDLHWSDQGNLQMSQCNQQNMADVNSITFWSQVAAAYKNDPWVLFELYNEPHDVSWSSWLNGGTDAGYTTVGMQQLYNAVRATGANNAVIVGGLNWSFDLSGVANYPVVGTNIIYNTHPYDYSGKQLADYPAAFGYLSSKYPLIATEYGEYNCNPLYNQLFINYANQIGMSWAAWAWYVSGCAFPSAISDWSGTASAAGVPVMTDLQCTNKVPGATINLCTSGGTAPTTAPAPSTPVTSAPVTSAPVTSAPATIAPATSAPVTSAPVTSGPKIPGISPTQAPVATTATLKVSVHTGATVWWYAIALVNGDSAVKVEMKDSGAVETYTAFTLTTWGYWIFPSTPAPLQAPFYIRVTSSSSAVVLITVPSLVPGAVIDSGASLSTGGGGNAVAAPSTPVTSAPVTSAPITSAPVTSPPVTSAPVTSAPVTSAPVTPAPPAPAPSTPVSSGQSLKVQINSGASAYWYAVALINGNTASKVEIKDSGSVSTFAAFSTTSWGYYIYSASGALQAPIYIRVTSTSGNSVVVTSSAINAGAVIDSGKSL